MNLPAAAALSGSIGYEFDDPGLLELALRHRSWVSEHEHPGALAFLSNERLELLGDAILGMVIAEHVYGNYETMPVGQLAKLKAGAISSDSLADWARRIDLGGALRLGRSEERSGGRRKQSILADAAEALIAAVYLDGGLEAARKVVIGGLGGRLASLGKNPGGDDYKTLLQEMAARDLGAEPVYKVSYSGPDHDRVYFAKVRVRRRVRGVGEGRSKKQAEQQAARSAVKSWGSPAGGNVSRAGESSEFPSRR